MATVGSASATLEALLRDPAFGGGFAVSETAHQAAHGMAVAFVTSRRVADDSLEARIAKVRTHLLAATVPDAAASTALIQDFIRAAATLAAPSAEGAAADDAEALDVLSAAFDAMYGGGAKAAALAASRPATPAAALEALWTSVARRAHAHGRADELLFAVAAALTAGAGAVAPPAVKSALAKLPQHLRVVAPSDLYTEMQRDTGMALRRILHHGVRLTPVSNSCSLDQGSREVRRSTNNTTTVVVQGAPVRSGKWYFEATAQSKDTMTSGWVTERAVFDYSSSSTGVGFEPMTWGWDGSRHERHYGR